MASSPCCKKRQIPFYICKWGVGDCGQNYLFLPGAGERGERKLVEGVGAMGYQMSLAFIVSEERHCIPMETGCLRELTDALDFEKI